MPYKTILKIFDEQEATEDIILLVFEHLLKKGYEPIEALNYIEEKIGEKKFFDIVENFNFLD